MSASTKRFLGSAFAASLLLLMGVPGHAQATPEPQVGCLTAREFITTLEFFRSQKDFNVPEEEARKVSKEVSQGCTGAASRYIRVARVLTHAGLGTTDALKAALLFSHRTDRETDSFLSLFTTAFAAEDLDLDLSAAIQLARSLSVDFPGDLVKARDDFETLARYCTDAKNLALPKAQCAQFAADIARTGQNWTGSASRGWIRIYEFLAFKKDGPNLITQKAIDYAKQAVTAGPDSVENFINGYRYAISSKGLDLPRDQAIAFAREMAFSAVKNSK